MPSIRDTLTHLRQLRQSEASHGDKAAEYLQRATHGTGSKRATAIGGTGNCPLTDYAERYSSQRKAAISARRQADALWQRVEPLLANLDFDSRGVIGRYYNLAMAWEDIPAAIKRSKVSCERMHREAIAVLERESW